MDAIEALVSRASRSKLARPVPTDRELSSILDAADRAPDHGGLRPLRLLVVTGAGLDRLAEAGVAATRAREPQSGPSDWDRMREKLTRAPMVIALAGSIDPAHPKIPEIEQILTVGAAGMNILNALHALGYAGKWVTGANAHDQEFARLLGFEGAERLFGLIMVGTPADASGASPTPRDVAVRFWN